MDFDFAERFAQDWVDGWNSHDLERILAHYADDVVFKSPHVVRLVGEASATVVGKDALRAYFGTALRLIPELRFEVLGVFMGVDTIVLTYRNHLGGTVNEVLTFDGGVIVAGQGTYPGQIAD